VEPIVVGVDGSAGSTAAVAWALAEARLRGAPVRLVHAYDLPRLPFDDTPLAAPGMAIPHGGDPETLERVRSASESQARAVIDTTLAEVGRDAAAGVEIHREVAAGPAASVLIEAGRTASLLVVGSRGRGGFVGLVLGSVSQTIAHHAPCPLVILPPVAESESGGA
jgi:nucleotide-binding universal stress UspA family protein